MNTYSSTMKVIVAYSAAKTIWGVANLWKPYTTKQLWTLNPKA